MFCSLAPWEERRKKTSLSQHLYIKVSSGHSLSCVWFFADPMDCSTPGFPVYHQLQSLLKLMSVELVVAFSQLFLCCSLLFLSSIFLPLSGPLSLSLGSLLLSRISSGPYPLPFAALPSASKHSQVLYVKNKMYVHTKLAHQCPQQHYLQKSKTGCNPDVQQVKEMWYSTQWDIIWQLKKGWSTDTYFNMDKPWKHCPK